MKNNLILQDIILNELRRKKAKTVFYLSTGREIEGIIQGFDNFTIILNVDNNKQIVVYKHNLVAIGEFSPILLDQ